MNFSFYIVNLTMFASLIGCTFIRDPQLVGWIDPVQAENTRIEMNLGGTWLAHPSPLLPANSYLPEVDDSDWQEVHVPGNWYSEGMADHRQYWFRKHFFMDSQWQRPSAQLRFEGVDYAADIWLNGHYLGFHEGYFEPFSFSVVDRLNYGGNNLLAVLVRAPQEISSLHKRLIKGVLNHHDTRPGGAWSPQSDPRNSGGIWAPVHLNLGGPLMMGDLTTRTKTEFEDQFGTVFLQFPAHLNHGVSLKSELTVELLPENFTAYRPFSFKRRWIRTLKPGVNQIDLQFAVRDIALWWPWEMGDPNLYKLVVVIAAENGFRDTREMRLGFRTITRRHPDKAWMVNGRRLFLRGTNYISTPWLGDAKDAELRRDLSLMRQTNINSVRVHAHLEPQRFYELCDEQGMLVWQDFPLQWGYEDSSLFEREARRQLSAMVRVYGMHASIFAWCIHNEPPWNAPWMVYKYPDYAPHQNRKLDEALFRHLGLIDPDRYSHMASTTEEHPWYGWYSGTFRDYGKETRENLITEFGAQALPRKETLRHFLTEEQLWPDTPEEWQKWAFHNFQKRETFDIAKISPGSDTASFIENTQTYQAKLIRFAVENYRRQRYQPVTGIFQFMFAETWPSMNWGIMDYQRLPKLGWYALRTAYQPVLPMIAVVGESRKPEINPGTVQVLVVNDLHRSFEQAQLHLDLLSRETIIDQHLWQVTLAEDRATDVGSWDLPDLELGSYQIQLRLLDARQSTVATNTWEFIIQ